MQKKKQNLFIEAEFEANSLVLKSALSDCYYDVGYKK